MLPWSSAERGRLADRWNRPSEAASRARASKSLAYSMWGGEGEGACQGRFINGDWIALSGSDRLPLAPISP